MNAYAYCSHIRRMMMKVAINKCHGGFSLSGLAAKKLAMMGSPVIEISSFDDWYGDSGPPDYEEWIDIGDGFEALRFVGDKPTDTLRKDGFIYNFPRWSADRSNPDLIGVIEEMGDGASGSLAEIMIVEIPDDVEYTIEEYDGLEWVAEKHRTW